MTLLKTKKNTGLAGVATLKVKQGAFDALNKGSGALGKVK